MKDNCEIMDFYQNKYDEDGRMARQTLEYMRCKEIIARYLSSAKMEIADIGGATGSFSYWLASMQHTVHLLDYVPRHIEQAEKNGERYNMRLASYTCGDARAVPYRDEQFDLVLEMGPLYHLQDSQDRAQCLDEAMRILRPGGVVICEAISRYANLFEGFLDRVIVEDVRFEGMLEENLLTGKHSPGDTGYFTTAYFHKPDELAQELKHAGFTEIALIPVEGFGSVVNAQEFLKDEHEAELLLNYIRQTESIYELLGVSNHFIAVGRKR